MSQRSNAIVRLVLAGLITIVLTAPAAAEVLISEQEARLPAAPGAIALTTRGVTRGPRVHLVSPAPNAGAVKSPLTFKLRFESFGGSKIDPASVKATYVREPAVDLTARVKRYIKEGGLEMDNAEVPPGDHMIKVDVKDTEGRSGTASVMLKVAN